MGVPISERLGKGNSEEFYRRMLENFASNLRVAVPGIIQEFDPVTQTVSVQVAIREKIIDSYMLQHWVEIPLLLDVPIVIPRAGGFALTLPVKPGDECLVVFADSCIDAWFSSGGVQNQIERRRHDLSDGFALLGVWSQPRTLSEYSTSAVQLRTDDGATRISMSPGEIDIVSSVVKINGVPWRN
ncbi:hypothetical protein QJ48_04060 [Paenibacillus sp. A3]|uniref:Gp138 family membrane-puncturing spike protein n=1 Tax=Paenibacillus sp. A3 TaxID=1337054 RepID=UPI0006D5897E|nr:Gp138 family membrane-puncturing spike protein [Paenibacillus sp. A3]KPV60714.1 hypothetical protein QJ48_04060 [Paenibacillus sp. A3]